MTRSVGPLPCTVIISTLLMTTPHFLLTTVTFTADDVLGTFSVTDGVKLMKAIVAMVYRKNQNHNFCLIAGLRSSVSNNQAGSMVSANHF